MARTNNRNLLLIILILAAANIVMLYLLTREEPKAPKQPELSRNERTIKMVQEELNLDSAQVQQYVALRVYRDSLLHPIQTDMRRAKLEMMRFLTADSVSADTIKMLAYRVGEQQAKMEIEYFNHFRRMEKMLQPVQVPKFDSLLIRMIYRGTGATDSLPKPAGK